MARNTQPIAKRCKALGISPAVMGYSKKVTERNAKGQMRRKQSEYGLQLNEKQQQVVMTTRYFIKDTILHFLIGYGKIMSITFVEQCIGLSVLGVDNSITISFLIALFDVLPVFGTGGIMIPWIIISLLMQDIKLAVGLTIVYLIITLIRNIIEPRIVGEQIGLHPLLMLLSMYLGIRFFGFLGLFLLPATLLLIKELNEKGILHIYKTEKEGPPA